MTKVENEILALKYQAPALSKLTAVELLKATSLLVLKIHVIVGWQVPEKELKNILIDQFTKKIKESYENINDQEIEYAFRQNTTVQDWGKNMNLALIDLVISEYLERRFEVSAREEKYRPPKELPPAEPEIIMEDDEFIEMNFKIWQTLGNYGMISIKCYTILVRQYKINLVQAEKDEIYNQAEIILKERMHNDRAWHNELYPLYINPNKELWKNILYNECKRKAVENYFKTLTPEPTQTP